MRVLQCVNIMNRAGIETMLMNHYRAIDRNRIQFDFLTHRAIDGEYDDEIRELGGRVFHAPRLFPQNYLSYYKYMENIFSLYDYRIVHSHIDAMSAFPLSAALKADIPIRIAHSHSTSIDRDYKYCVKMILKRELVKYANNYWGCSEQAINFLFGPNSTESSKCFVFRNAINLMPFDYNETNRKEKRIALGVDDNTVLVGHVGRFSKVKNHRFLIEVMSELLKITSKIELLLIGDGETRASTKELVHMYGLDQKVRFLGTRSDVSDLMQAMDVFVFPSFYEGIPLSVIEAQVSNLPIVMSDTVSREAAICNCCIRMSLKKTAAEWADAVIGAIKKSVRQSNYSILAAEGYNVYDNAKMLEQKYYSLLDCH